MSVDPNPEQHGPPNDIWVSIVILARVVIILTAFLAVFLAIFMGYFTFPIILIMLSSIVYLILDRDFFLRLRQRLRARLKRQDLS
jgi:hypothetical protein